MPQTLDVSYRIVEMIHELTAVPLDDIRPDHDLRLDLNMDSVASMELVAMLDEEFDIDVGLDESMEIRTVAEAQALAARYLAQ